MKTTLREIKTLVITGKAENITRHGLPEYKELKAKEKYFDTVSISHGVNGVSGLVIQGATSGKLYAITARSSALFIYL